MSTLILLILILLFLNSGKKKKKKAPTPPTDSNILNVQRQEAVKTERAVQKDQQKTSSRKPIVTALPNLRRNPPLTPSEQRYQSNTRYDQAACNYEAAYSKGRPYRIGERGDYGEAVLPGQYAIRCGYCAALNLVPAGTKEHYHCYFCWEALNRRENA